MPQESGLKPVPPPVTTATSPVQSNSLRLLMLLSVAMRSGIEWLMQRKKEAWGLRSTVDGKLLQTEELVC